MEKIENARKTLKVLGIITIVIGALGILVGIMSLASGGLLAGGLSSSVLSSLVSVALAACIVWAAKTIKDYNAGGGNSGNGQLPPQQ